MILHLGEEKTSAGYVDVVVVGEAYRGSVSVCCANDSNPHNHRLL